MYAKYFFLSKNDWKYYYELSIKQTYVVGSFRNVDYNRELFQWGRLIRIKSRNFQTD